MKNITFSRRGTLGFVVLVLSMVASLSSYAQQAISFSKEFIPDTIGPGSTSTLVFTITNNASFSVTDLAFTDVLPAAVSIASPANAITDCDSADITAIDGGIAISISGGRLGAFRSCQVLVNVTSSTPGTHTNTSGDLTSSAGNSGSATADLDVVTTLPGFSKSFAPATIPLGDPSTLTFTIDNSANGANVPTLDFQDNLPAGLVIASPANASTDCGTAVIPATLTATAGSSQIVLDADGTFGFPALAAGSTCTVTVDVKATGAGRLINESGDLLANFVSSGKATAALDVTVSTLALTKSFIDDPVTPGSTVNLEFTLYNFDRNFTATGVQFSDDIFSALDLSPAETLPKNVCGGTLDFTSPLLSLTGASVAGGSVCTFNVLLLVNATPGIYSNTTTPVEGMIDGAPVTGNAATDRLFVDFVPILTKEFIDDPVGAGDNVILRFEIINSDPTNALLNIAFIDELTSFLPFPISAVLPTEPCGVGSSLSLISLGTERQGLALSDGELAAGSSCIFDVTITIPPGLPAGTYNNITGEISGEIGEVTVIGPGASDDLEVVGAPDLVKVFTDGPVQPGNTTTLEFTISYDELAVDDATDINFTDNLEAVILGLVGTGLPASDVCGTGSLLDGTGLLSLTGGTLAPGESCTFSVSVEVPATATSGVYTNTTSNLTSTVSGIEVIGDVAEDDLVVSGVTFSKSFTDDPVLPGGTATLEFTITNLDATLEVSGMLFTDNLNETLSGLAATGLPLSDVCGTGSSLTGTTFLTFTGGVLPASDSCTFSVTVNVPVGAADDSYRNTTSQLTTSFGPVPPATDVLVVESDVLSIAKEFTDDPVTPGAPVTLEFTLTNLDDSNTISNIAFSDDLDAAISGLVAIGLPASDVCGVGSELSGAGLLSLTGGSLAAGTFCTFSATLQVPTPLAPGNYANTTSEITGDLNGLVVTGDPAIDELIVSSLILTKSFAENPTVAAGEEAIMSFNIMNPSTETQTRLSFSDDIDGFIPGAVRTGAALMDVCGAGSSLDGIGSIFLSDGSLGPGASCSFDVTLLVPVDTVPGDYINTTSSLIQTGLVVGNPASATLTVLLPVLDADNDGVLDDVDVCLNTVIPESVPTVILKPNNYALVDNDTIFDVGTSKGKGNKDPDIFTIEDTGGCSCEQIIDAMDLGDGHTKHGCSLGAMREWIEFLQSPSLQW